MKTSRILITIFEESYTARDMEFFKPYYKCIIFSFIGLYGLYPLKKDIDSNKFKKVYKIKWIKA